MNNPQICVVGGAGRVGAPLSIVFATRGFHTAIFDLNRRVMDQLASGHLPYVEEGGQERLTEALAAKTLSFTTDPSTVAGVPYVIITIGTPIDEFHNPNLYLIQECIDSFLPYLTDGQTLILRSTVFPGVTDWLHRYLVNKGKHVHVAFCPERVVQGEGIREIAQLPQIVSGATPEAEGKAATLFEAIAPKVVRMTPKEAEFAKLISNAYRYIQFAATNQFYMMVTNAGCDYHRIISGLRDDFPRAKALPGPGFAAGPCLFKDTMQLVAFMNNTFSIGYAAMQVNESLPAFVVERIASKFPLDQLTVGVLGMAFKANSDDVRSSLSYKLKRILKYRCKEVLTTDPLVQTDSELLPLDEVIDRADLLIIGAPHRVYKDMDTRGKPLFDIWNFLDD